MSITILGIIIIAVLAVVYFLKKPKEQPDKKDVNKKSSAEQIKDSNKVMEKSTKNIPQKNINDFMEFDKISDNMIVQNGGKRYTMVVQCKGINYDLMSEVEQMSVEEGFITFLNTLKFPIQLYVQARAVDLKENLNIYKKSVKETENKYNEIEDKYRNLLNNIDADYSDISKLKNQVDKQAHILSYAQDITRYVERISLNKSILQRKFYIVLSYNKAEITATADFSEQELYNICYRELYTRAQSLISALSGCSVTGKVLNSNELAELLYISYNRDDEKLLDIKTALESGFYRLYSTSKDVFEKREEAMQREVNEEAKRRVQEAIQDVLKDQEKKTPDELVEEYEERVDKEALDIIEQSDTPKEAKKLLKDNIVEKHVIGVETRKLDRKLRKEIKNSPNEVKENNDINMESSKEKTASDDALKLDDKTETKENLSDLNNNSNSNTFNEHFAEGNDSIVASSFNKSNAIKEDEEENITKNNIDKNNENKKNQTTEQNIEVFDDRLSNVNLDDDDNININ